MEKFNSQEYRDDLAHKIKDEPEHTKRKAILDKEKEKTDEQGWPLREYEISDYLHRKENNPEMTVNKEYLVSPENKALFWLEDLLLSNKTKDQINFEKYAQGPHPTEEEYNAMSKEEKLENTYVKFKMKEMIEDQISKTRFNLETLRKKKILPNTLEDFCSELNGKSEEDIEDYEIKFIDQLSTLGHIEQEKIRQIIIDRIGYKNSRAEKMLQRFGGELSNEEMENLKMRDLCSSLESLSFQNSVKLLEGFDIEEQIAKFPNIRESLIKAAVKSLNSNLYFRDQENNLEFLFENFVKSKETNEIIANSPEFKRTLLERLSQRALGAAFVSDSSLTELVNFKNFLSKLGIEYGDDMKKVVREGYEQMVKKNQEDTSMFKSDYMVQHYGGEYSGLYIKLNTSKLMQQLEKDGLI